MAPEEGGRTPQGQSAEAAQKPAGLKFVGGAAPAPEVKLSGYKVNPDTGLTEAEVEQRRAEGKTNVDDAGQTKTVSIPLAVSDLSYYDDAKGEWRVDPIGYRIIVGNSSMDPDALEAVLEVR